MGTFIIGDISFHPSEMRFGKPLFELWDWQTYSTRSKAEKALKKLKKKLEDEGHPHPSLKVVDDDKYDLLENYL